MSSTADLLGSFKPARDPALEVGLNSLEADTSGVGERTNLYYPTQGPVASGTDPLSYTGQNLTFDISPGATTRVRFDKSFITITGYAANMTIGSASPVLVGASIPWNTIAAVLQSAKIQFNSQSDNIENIQNELGHGSMMKMLTTYSRTQLEAKDDAFFTPCIESSRDLNTGIPPITLLSTTSQTRRTSQLLNGDGTQRIISKNIYFCDLFDSMYFPAAWLVKNLHLELGFKTSDAILIKDTGCLGVNAPTQKFFISSVVLNLTQLQLSSDEIAKADTLLRTDPGGVLVRDPFYMYDVVPKTHSTGAAHRDSNVKNLQAAIVAFPSNRVKDGAGANPYQYTYDADVNFVSGITGYQMRYDNVDSPAQRLSIATGVKNTGQNTRLYGQYRLICKGMRDRQTELALSMNEFAPNVATTEDVAPYVLLCSQFYSLTASDHLLAGGSDHEVYIDGGTDSQIIICRIRTGYAMVNNAGAVAVLQ